MSGVIAFGSCNKQYKNQTHWQIIAKLEPTHFIWAGDAVYGKGTGIHKVQEAYRTLGQDSSYSKFKSDVIIDGVWDDHDYGVNDAGKHVSDRKDRQKAYVEFLTSGSEPMYSTLVVQDGLYHSSTIYIAGMQLKVIFLDTRSFRDHHYIRSLGEIRFPFTALVASGLRGLYSVFGFGRDYGGEVLGSAQWGWLEGELANSTADMHVLVSSIQVMTSNPVVEGWGHFPVEQRRLFSLLRRTDPRGLVMLSGDVHLGEVSRTSFQRADGSRGEWVEVTSSGLTHTAADDRFTEVLCPLMMRLFGSHRAREDDYYTGRNFGTIEVHRVPAAEELSPVGWSVGVHVRSLESEPYGSDSTGGQRSTGLSQAVLSHVVTISNGMNIDNSLSRIVSVQYPRFPVLPYPVRMAVYLVVFLAATWIYSMVLRRFKKRRKATEVKKKQ